MASTAKDRPIIDWEALGKITNLEEALPFIPPDRVIANLGWAQIIAASDKEKVLKELLEQVPPEQFQEMLSHLQKKK
jgi:hypothetical protein